MSLSTLIVAVFAGELYVSRSGLITMTLIPLSLKSYESIPASFGNVLCSLSRTRNSGSGSSIMYPSSSTSASYTSGCSSVAGGSPSVSFHGEPPHAVRRNSAIDRIAIFFM